MGQIEGVLAHAALPGETEEPQGLGTVERPEGPNGEVPKPLRPSRLRGKCRIAAKRARGPAGVSGKRMIIIIAKLPPKVKRDFWAK